MADPALLTWLEDHGLGSCYEELARTELGVIGLRSMPDTTLQ